MALLFDGVDDIVTTALTSHSTGRTWAIWAYRVSTGEAANGRIWDKLSSGGNPSENLFSSTTEYRFSRSFTSGNSGTWGFTAPAVNVWGHVAITYDSGAISNDPVPYVNGGAVALTTDTNPAAGTAVSTAHPYHLGNRGATDRTWDGRLAEFVVYNRILTADEIAILYVSGPNGLPFTPAVYHPLWGQSTTEPDLSGNNLAATTTGAAYVDHPPRISVWHAHPRLANRPIVAGGGSGGPVYTNMYRRRRR